MNINPQPTALNLATVVNPSTDSLRRDNVSREVITQPAAVSNSAAEKGVASDRERAKSPSQNNEQIDFASLQEQAEQENSTINERQRGEQQNSQAQQQDADASNAEEDNSGEQRNASENSNDPNDISEQELKQIQELEARDAEVKAHERAHDAVGGSYTGSPSYAYQVGPDGKRYAVGGEVSVDLSEVPGDPRATIQKMQRVRAAALAPAQPSTQDIKVASKAQRNIADAHTELSQEARAKLNGEEETSSTDEVSYRSHDTFSRVGEQQLDSEDVKANVSSAEFDDLANRTIKAQDKITGEVQQRESLYTERAAVIESVYANINQAYDKPPRYQFELTA